MRRARKRRAKPVARYAHDDFRDDDDVEAGPSRVLWSMNGLLKRTNDRTEVQYGSLAWRQVAAFKAFLNGSGFPSWVSMVRPRKTWTWASELSSRVPGSGGASKGVREMSSEISRNTNSALYRQAGALAKTNQILQSEETIGPVFGRYISERQRTSSRRT